MPICVWFLLVAKVIFLSLSIFSFKGKVYGSVKYLLGAADESERGNVWLLETSSGL